MLKSTVKSKVKKQVDEYPCLKIAEDDGTIILFSAPLKGMCIYPGKDTMRKMGEYHSKWNEAVFTPFCGEVTLKQE
jgi:hypothetical protein